MTEPTNKKIVRSRKAKIFITTMLITIQGLYVIFPLPDIWPFSNYSMFSKANPSTIASSFKFYGITSDGKEVLLDSKEAFLPFDRIRLRKGVSRILNRESFILKQERRIESVFKHLRFLPVDHAELEEILRNLLPYKDGVEEAVAEVKEKELRVLFDYLLSQYEYNRKEKFHGGPPVVSMNLYMTKWDWTDAPPGKAIPEIELVYSSGRGLVKDE